MILYHASNVIVANPDIYHSRKNLDFGRGFYLTIIREQAIKYGLRFISRGKKAYLNVYELNANINNIRYKKFAAYDDEWLDFVGQCRKGINKENTYDIVEGGIANDKVFNTLDLYFSGQMSRDDALGRLKYENPNHQICILSQNVIEKHLHFIKAEEII